MNQSDLTNLKFNKVSGLRPNFMVASNTQSHENFLGRSWGGSYACNKPSSREYSPGWQKER